MITYTPLDYRSRTKPVWCAGCGDYGVLAALYKALSVKKVNPKDVVIVSGIGCSSRLPDFVKAYGFHGAHGRALPVAIGIKAANPSLTVFVAGGDGDGLSIGAGHLPHAARKNVDITYILMDNAIYGMTKGQCSPTSELDFESGSSPYGTIEEPLDPIALSLIYGSTFVARGYSGSSKIDQLIDLIIKAVEHKGFSFIQVLSPCVTYNRVVTFQSLNAQVVDIDKEHDITDRNKALALALNEKKLYVGLFYKTDKPTFNERLDAISEECGKGGLDIERLYVKFT
ncbi:MAG TPA: 2-oxoacid:ferredoxin oxidoreductase subunit beta [Candidatus Brocadiia bacterium]|nr:2-oxoacid:ferredoxin oxidoreductase subunit beta [Candidatus Brocadiales bacterium]